VSSIAALVDFVKNNFVKLFRFAAVSMVMVPTGLALMAVFLWMDLHRVWASLLSSSITAVPSYLLNRSWVWSKSGANSIKREIAPFWAMTLLGVAISALFVWIAGQMTDNSLAFLFAQFAGFGVVWLLKFFVLEKYLFGESTHDNEVVTA